MWDLFRLILEVGGGWKYNGGVEFVLSTLYACMELSQ
jgi:hypothetical protein